MILGVEGSSGPKGSNSLLHPNRTQIQTLVQPFPSNHPAAQGPNRVPLTSKESSRFLSALSSSPPGPHNTLASLLGRQTD